MRTAVTVAAALLLAACAQVKQHKQLANPVGVQLQTHVGGSVMRIHRSGDLPNAFGKADVFGRKINQGYVEARYQGLTADGRVVYRIKDMETFSNETTMSRSPMAFSNTATRGTVNRGGGFNANSTTVGVQAPQGSTVPLPADETEVALAVTEPLTIHGYRIHVLKAEPAGLTYRIARATD